MQGLRRLEVEIIRSYSKYSAMKRRDLYLILYITYTIYIYTIDAYIYFFVKMSIIMIIQYLNI